MRNAPPTLQRALLRWLLTPLLGLMLASGLVAYKMALNFSQLAFDRALGELAYDIGATLEKLPTGLTDPLHLPHAARDLILSDSRDEIYFCIRDIHGQFLSGDRRLLPAAGAHNQNNRLYYDTHIDGKLLRAISFLYQIDYPDGPRTVQILVAETRHKRDRLAEEILTSVVLPQLLFVALVYGIVRFGVKRGLHPLNRLEEAVASRSHRDLSPVEAPDAPAELQPMVRAINDLLARVRALLEAQNRFVADAAHQLRTPLAGLKAQIEFASRQQSPDELCHSLVQVQIGTERLTHVFNQLLSVARNEPGADRLLELKPVDLNALAQAVTAEWIAAALKREIDLGFEGAGNPVMVNGDSSRLTEMLNNLVDNALRYTQPGGMVTVRVNATGQLEVEDNGPGIPPEERERVFERFHRLGGNDIEGSGLGLAIVQEIAQIHGASVQADAGAQGVGACFRLRFPLSDGVAH